MYSVGIMPILVSAMAVNAQTGSFNPTTILLFSFAAICIIAWLNLSNDVFDSVTGVDKSKKESLVNLTGNRTMVFLTANALLLVGAGLLFYMIQSTLVAKMLYAAICMGYLYQGPPFRWSYLGIGEPLCFIAFGPLATCAFYLAQLPSSSSSAAAGAAVSLSSLTPTIIALSVLVGITTTVILFCSHFHQIEGDTRAGKMSPLVRLGLLKGAVALKVAVGFTYMLTLVVSLLGILPFACWTSAMVCYPIAGEMARLAEEGAAASGVVEGGDDRVAAEKLAPLKMIATKWHIAFQSCMMLGFVIQKLMVM
jgi:1,4-dihydroxy-2-naphthoate octaprenyltransferase